MALSKQDFKLKDIDWTEVKSIFIDSQFIWSVAILLLLFTLCSLFWSDYFDKYKDILILFIFVYDLIIINPKIKVKKSYKQKGKIFIFLFLLILLILVRSIVLKNSSAIAELTALIFQGYIVIGIIGEGLKKNLIKSKLKK